MFQLSLIFKHVILAVGYNSYIHILFRVALMFRSKLAQIRKIRILSTLLFVSLIPVLLYGAFTFQWVYKDSINHFELDADAAIESLAENIMTTSVIYNGSFPMDKDYNPYIQGVVRFELSLNGKVHSFNYSKDIKSLSRVSRFLQPDNNYISVFSLDEMRHKESTEDKITSNNYVILEFSAKHWGNLIVPRVKYHVITFSLILVFTILICLLISSGAEHHFATIAAFIRKSDYRKNISEKDLIKLRLSKEYLGTINDVCFYEKSSPGQLGTLERALVDISALWHALIANQRSAIEEAIAEQERKSMLIEATRKKQIETKDKNDAELRRMHSELEASNKELESKNVELIAKSRVASNAEKIMSSFIQNMSHEVRTPLNAINNFSDLIHTAGELNRPQVEYLGNVKKAGRALVDFFDEVLIFQKVESGRYSSKLESFDLIDEIESIIEAESAKISKKGLKISFIPDYEMPTYVQFDLVAFRLIFRNIISNAVKFTDIGGVVIRSFRAESLDNGKELIIFRVEDTGIGISESDKEEIFHLLGQLDNTESRKYEGVGLGLALASQLTRFLEGTITLETQVGVGSIFTCSLPMKKEGAISPAQRNIIRTSYLESTIYNITVVDDDQDFLDSMSARLEYLGLDSNIYKVDKDLHPSSLQVNDFHTGLLILRDFNRYQDPNSYGLLKKINTNKIVALESQLDTAHIQSTLHNDDVFAVAPTFIKARKLFTYISSVFGFETSGVNSDLISETGNIPVLSGYRVLNADSNELSRKATNGILSNLGATTIEAEDHEKALILVELGVFDLAFVDLSLQSISGEQTALLVKERNLRCPVIGIGTSQLEAVDSNSSGAIEFFLSRPVITEDLFSIIHDLNVSGKIRTNV